MHELDASCAAMNILRQLSLVQGMAKSLSRALLGQEIEGVWHASLVVGKQEYFYGELQVIC